MSDHPPARVLLTAIEYRDSEGGLRHLVPLLDPSDTTWWVLNEDGSYYYKTPQDVRDFVTQVRADIAAEDSDEDDSWLDAYEKLAELLTEQEAAMGIER